MREKINKLFKLEYIFVFAILVIAFVLRIYRVGEILGFYYDQGRDALVIWDLINAPHKLFLIGPMMADTGIFRGPWYYWLILPFYFLGNGNPLYPAVFLILTSVIAIFFVYKLGGIRPAVLATISVYLINAARWLSNPTPTLLVSVLIILSTYQFINKKLWAIPLIGFLVGLALNFSAATDIFYIPALLIIFIIYRKLLPKFKIILISFFTFLITFVPQIIFEIRHPGIQSGAFLQFLFKENSFTISFWEILVTRLSFYYNLFASKFWINGGSIFAPFFILFIILLVVNWKIYWKDYKFKILFIFSIVPFIGTLFFNGTSGNVYEYYFTGYYLVWILLFAYVLKNKYLFVFFVLVSMVMNIMAYKDLYLNSVDGPNVIVYTNQLKAIDWVYQNAGSRDFNVDVYVPPVIPYAYDYLFKWYGTTKYHRLSQTSQVPLLYTLYEGNPEHPERLQAWLSRQKGIGVIIKEQTFGGITVQERTRIIKK